MYATYISLQYFLFIIKNRRCLTNEGHKKSFESENHYYFSRKWKRSKMLRLQNFPEFNRFLFCLSLQTYLNNQEVNLNSPYHWNIFPSSIQHHAMQFPRLISVNASVCPWENFIISSVDVFNTCSILITSLESFNNCTSLLKLLHFMK